MILDMAASSPVRATPEEVTRLRAEIARIERTNRVGSDSRLLPVPTGIARLLPEGGLRAGAMYSFAPSMPLLTALLAEPSKAGAWCAVLGMPDLGAEAAAEAGIDLSRLAIIPCPGERWLGVASAIAEVVGVIALRPGGRIGDRDVSRLSARLRERGTVLLVEGSWQQAEAAIGVEDLAWSGLGIGHGHIERLEATIVVASRRSPAPRRGRTILVGAPGPAIPLRGREQGDTGGHDTGGHDTGGLETGGLERGEGASSEPTGLRAVELRAVG